MKKTNGGLELILLRKKLSMPLRVRKGIRLPVRPKVISKKCWSFMKIEIMATLSKFQERAFLYKSQEHFPLSLIPNKERDRTIRDFRSISLLSRIYKILSKALTLRLGRLWAHLYMSIKWTVWKLDTYKKTWEERNTPQNRCGMKKPSSSLYPIKSPWVSCCPIKNPHFFICTP